MNVKMFYLKNVILYSTVKYRPTTPCSLQAYNLPWNLPWTIRRISIGYPLINGDLSTAYDLPCGASHLFRVIAYRRACALIFASMAKCTTQFVNGSRFEFQCSALIKRPNAQIGQMRLTTQWKRIVCHFF